MLTAVVHDFGKIISTTEENGEIHSYGHAKKGDPLVKEFLERITNETKLIRYVRNLASLHMRPYELAREQAGKKATNQMFDSVTVPSDLILFSTADQMGKGKGQIIPEYEDFLKERLDWYQYTMAQPCVMGADLIKAGLKPGPKFSEILAYSHDLHLSNVPKDEALAPNACICAKTCISVKNDIITCTICTKYKGHCTAKRQKIRRNFTFLQKSDILTIV